MSDIPGENLLKRKKVGTDQKCCFENCRSDSRYKSYLECFVCHRIKLSAYYRNVIEIENNNFIFSFTMIYSL